MEAMEWLRAYRKQCGARKAIAIRERFKVCKSFQKVRRWRPWSDAEAIGNIATLKVHRHWEVFTVWGEYSQKRSLDALERFRGYRKQCGAAGGIATE